MTESKLKCAVVGVGYLGRFHAQKYQQLDDATLIGVCDSSLDRAKEVANELGVEAFGHPKDLIGKVEAVTIASTTIHHFELAKLFLEAGIHVNVEKPMTETLDQATTLCQLAKSKNLNLSVGHIERFNPVFVELEKQVKRPLLIECVRHAPFRKRGSDVGVAHDLMIHDIDLALTLAKSPVRRVLAQGTILAGSSWDAINATLEFESGAIAQISASRVASDMKRAIRVIEEGRISQGDFMNATLEVSTRVSEPSEEAGWVDHSKIGLEKRDALFEETKAFVHAVRTQTVSKVSGDDGARALEVVEKVINAL